MKLDGKCGATLFTPHPALGGGSLEADGIRRLSGFPSSDRIAHLQVLKEVRTDA